MSNETTRFKVTLEFDVDISPIDVPDVQAFQKLGAPSQAKKPPSEKEMRAGLKAKGMTEADIEKYMAGAKAKKDGAGKGGKAQPRNYQMLVYPEYESWAAAQRSLQEKILADENLSDAYIREIVRDLTEGQIEALIADKYGAADLNGVLKQAMQTISASDQALLKLEEESQMFDETELVDDSVDCRFAGLTVTRT
jgi:hypothetical protein